MNVAGPQMSGPLSFWKLLGSFLSGGTSSTPDQKFGTLNDYDLVFIRNNVDEGRFNADGLLIGGTSSGNIPAKLQVFGSVSGSRLAKYVILAATPVLSTLRLSRTTTVGAALSTIVAGSATDFNFTTRFTVTARQTGGGVGTVGDMCSFIKTVSMSNVGGVLTKLNEQSDYTYKIDPGFDFTVGTAGGNFSLGFQGVAGRNMSWALKTEDMFMSL